MRLTFPAGDHPLDVSASDRVGHREPGQRLPKVMQPVEPNTHVGVTSIVPAAAPPEIFFSSDKNPVYFSKCKSGTQASAVKRNTPLVFDGIQSGLPSKRFFSLVKRMSITKRTIESHSLKGTSRPSESMSLFAPATTR